VTLKSIMSTLLQKGFSQDDRVDYVGPHIFTCYEK
jgi:hypothetical protein